MSNLEQPSVIIVGAGAAGISAATKLITNGLTNVTILEAENRIGGRIHSVPFGGTIVDLGAQWIHGEAGNVVYDMVKNTGLVGYPQSASYHYVNFLTSTGEKLDQNVTNQLNDIALEIFDDSESAAKHGGSLKDYFEKEYDRRVVEKFGQYPSVAHLVRDWYEKFHLCLDPADDLGDVAAASVYQYEEGDGERLVHWKTNGYSSLFQIMMAKTPHLVKNNVKLNKTVQHISWQRPKALVRCTDGSTYEADHVIVTVSIGVLKHLKDLFEPKLPDYKLNCIENIPFGCCQKIMLKFAKAWWPSDVKDFSFVWTSEDQKRFLDEVPEEFSQALKGCSISRSWILDIFGFYTVDSHPDILLGWLVGPLNKEVESLPDEVVSEASMYLLKKFAGSYYEITYPVEMLRTTWGTNPNFLGTYSYVGMETERAKVKREDLVRPLSFEGKEVVQFAGEATHDKFFSAVAGAVESGYREADRLIQTYGSKEYHKVIIIGAGMAGLGAATKLLENNIDFLILEAQSQPGGRIKTISVEGKPLDLGAQWMHGKDNPLYRLAKQHNLLSEEVSEEGLGQYVRSNGDLVDPFTVQLVSFKFGQILEQCSELTKSEEHTLPLGAYLEEHFNQYLDEQTLNNEEKEIYRELFDWNVRFHVVDNSCLDLSRLSTKRWADYVCEDDEAHSNLKFGYQSLVEVILEDFPNERIRFDSEVVHIGSYLKGGAVLQTKNGDMLICDHLILTPSLGVLKSLDFLKKVLPEKMLTNIENMGFAGICKIFLFFDEKWWGDAKGFQLLWNQNFSFEDDASWLRYITGFDQVFNHENALITWVGGCAVDEVERLDPELIGRQCTQFLQKFLKKYLVPLPNKVIRTQWQSHPFVQGSYCHITPECDAPDSGIAVLKEPVIIEGVPRVVLAGEAVHQTHYSTTHGAFESGLDQARIICDFIESNSDN